MPSFFANTVSPRQRLKTCASNVHPCAHEQGHGLMQYWDITRTTYKVSDFLSWQRSKSLVLSPSFQRRPVWKPDAKSFLVDTVARGLPMPVIFLREQASDPRSYEPKREVVDGQQRIRTLLTYIDSSSLADYSHDRDFFSVKRNHNQDLAGKQFKDLPKDIRQRILDYQFSVHVLPSKIDDREVLQLFARMNATGVKLNDQELRNAEWFGEFKTSMYELASEQLPRWRNWLVFTEYNIARMEEVELVSEFALLMLTGLSGKTQSSIDNGYKKYDERFPERTEVERRFRAVMDAIEDRFGTVMKSLPFRQKTLFYSLFAFAYDLLFGLGSSMKPKKAGGISSLTVSWATTAGERIAAGKAPEGVLDATSRRTTHLSSRKLILDYLSQGAIDGHGRS